MKKFTFIGFIEPAAVPALSMGLRRFFRELAWSFQSKLSFFLLYNASPYYRCRYFLSRYFRGVIPVCFLKNRETPDADGKFIMRAISASL